MSDLPNLLHRARAYAEHQDIELTTVSKRLFGDWRRIDALAAGTSFLRPPTLISALARMAELEAAAGISSPTATGAHDGEAYGEEARRQERGS